VETDPAMTTRGEQRIASPDGSFLRTLVTAG
jgi:hypothetical protein